MCSFLLKMIGKYYKIGSICFEDINGRYEIK